MWFSAVKIQFGWLTIELCLWQDSIEKSSTVCFATIKRKPLSLKARTHTHNTLAQVNIYALHNVACLALCIQRCKFADLSCNKCLFDLLLPFFGLQPVCLLWPLTPDINNKTIFFLHTTVSLTWYFLFLRPLPVKPWGECDIKSLTRSSWCSPSVVDNHICQDQMHSIPPSSSLSEHTNLLPFDWVTS